MNTRTRAARLTVLAAALSLALASCGGSDGQAVEDDVPAGLPTADDLGDSDGQPVEDDAPADSGEEAPATSGMCAADEPDCQDTIDDTRAPAEGDGTNGRAAGSCLAGDTDCTDESYGGQDVARPIPLTDTPSDAARIAPGTTAGASGRRLLAAHLPDDTTLELTFEGGACDVLEAVEVIESPGEVRILVLSGMDASVDACTQQVVTWSTEVQLDEPLGDRALLDLAG